MSPMVGLQGSMESIGEVAPRKTAHLLVGCIQHTGPKYPGEQISGQGPLHLFGVISAQLQLPSQLHDQRPPLACLGPHQRWAGCLGQKPQGLGSLGAYLRQMEILLMKV